MLVGNKAPCRKQYEPGRKEWKQWQQRRTILAKEARNGVSVKEALSYVRDPRWRWGDER